MDCRAIKVVFFDEWGECMAYLGKTIVMSRVSAEITQPKASSPTKGALHVKFGDSSMSAPNVNLSRLSGEYIGLQSCLQRCIRDSKCIDLESLCIVAGVKVWTVRVDSCVLNDDGNVSECASIALISALAPFKRPDVTVIGTQVTVHSLDDHEPVPLNLQHMPIAINMALFCQGTCIVMDPTELEERIADGCFRVGLNAHQELCFIDRRGSLLFPENTVQKCIDLAVHRTKTVITTIRGALNDDAYQRATKAPIGIVFQKGNILGNSFPVYTFDISPLGIRQYGVEMVEEEPDVLMGWDGRPDIPIPVIVPSFSAIKENAQRILK